MTLPPFVRRFARVSAALCLVAASAITGASSASGRLERVESSDEAMGTTFSLVLYGRDRAALDAASAAALREVHRLDALLSNYEANSEWSAVNHSAASGAVRVSPELFQLLAACLTYSQKSEGTFDITVGPLMKVWGFYKDEGRLPRPAAVTEALFLVGYRHVVLDSEHQTVQFDRSGVELDPGGIGKGYAVDRVIEVLKRHDVDAAFVSAGGSSIYGLGTPPAESRGWPVALRSPADPHQSLGQVFLNDMSLSTSGSYEKFFRANGRLYSHIMDPRTGYPARGASSVSVLARRTIDSEAWAKPYFINGRSWTAAHLAQDMAVFFCDDQTSQACDWIRR
jgi:FAD:protein FMN transferase